MLKLGVLSAMFPEPANRAVSKTTKDFIFLCEFSTQSQLMLLIWFCLNMVQDGRKREGYKNLIYLCLTMNVSFKKSKQLKIRKYTAKGI